MKSLYSYNGKQIQGLRKAANFYNNSLLKIYARMFFNTKDNMFSCLIDLEGDSWDSLLYDPADIIEVKELERQEDETGAKGTKKWMQRCLKVALDEHEIEDIRPTLDSEVYEVSSQILAENRQAYELLA